jgi:predicted  nucleic acid-binding Zn-ribbon protein
MTGQGYDELKILNRKLDELFNRYADLKTELTNLRNGNEELKSALQERENRIKELELKYERIKLTGALMGDGENAQEAKRKITDLVREIDKCVALLNR